MHLWAGTVEETEKQKDRIQKQNKLYKYFQRTDKSFFNAHISCIFYSTIFVKSSA